jgi:ubiquinone/menaquinone biosynthesis C-methylase UbiE
MQQTLALRGGTSLLDADQTLSRLEIKQSYTVADLGCGGNGHFVGPLASLVGRLGKIYALDVQKKVLDSVSSKIQLLGLSNVELVWSDLEQYGAASIPEGSCDITLLVNVLFQNTHHETMLREAARFVRAGGRVAVIEWKPIATPFGPPVELRLSPGFMKELGKSAQLRSFDGFDAGPYHYVEVFIKG